MNFKLALLATLVTSCMAETRFAGYGFPNNDCTGISIPLDATDGKVSGGILHSVLAVKTVASASLYADANCKGKGYPASTDKCSSIDQSTIIQCMSINFGS